MHYLLVGHVRRCLARYTAAVPQKAKPRQRSKSLAQRQKEKKNKCLREKTDGTLCTKSAGWGTNHPGTGPCKHHTGSTRNGNMAAAREEATSAVKHGMAKKLAVTPAQAITAVLHLTAGQLAYATAKVAMLTEDETFEWITNDEGAKVPIENRWIRLQRSLQKDLARYTKAAADMGIAERQQNLAEQQMSMFKQLLDAVVGEIGLTQKQRKLLGPAIRNAMPGIIDAQAVEVPA